jgi:hypothetical protein
MLNMYCKTWPLKSYLIYKRRSAKLTNHISMYSGDAFIVLCVSEALFVTHACFKRDWVTEVYIRFYKVKLSNLRCCSNIPHFLAPFSRNRLLKCHRRQTELKCVLKNSIKNLGKSMWGILHSATIGELLKPVFSLGSVPKTTEAFSLGSDPRL